MIEKRKMVYDVEYICVIYGKIWTAYPWFIGCYIQSATKKGILLFTFYQCNIARYMNIITSLCRVHFSIYIDFLTLPRYNPMKKSAAAKLQTKNLGTSILFLLKESTKTTHPFPKSARRKTTQTPHLRVHQSNKSLHGRNGPGAG